MQKWLLPRPSVAGLSAPAFVASPPITRSGKSQQLPPPPTSLTDSSHFPDRITYKRKSGRPLKAAPPTAMSSPLTASPYGYIRLPDSLLALLQPNTTVPLPRTTVIPVVPLGTAMAGSPPVQQSANEPSSVLYGSTVQPRTIIERVAANTHGSTEDHSNSTQQQPWTSLFTKKPRSTGRMFRAFGHDNVWVLNGGLPEWRASGYDVESSASGDTVLKARAASDAVEKVYNGQVGPTTFEAKLQPHLLWTVEQIKQNIIDQRYQHVDARTKARFDGQAPETRKEISSGHIPGSKCIPFGQVLDGSQMLLPSEELAKRFEQHDISLDRPIVASCAIGMTACILALGFHRVGKMDVPIYDGSWTEWATLPDSPIVTST